MTGTPYLEKYDRAYVEDLLKKLTDMGAKIALLTGVGFKEGETGVMGYEQATGEFFYYSHAKHPISYHGTGDIFSSTCIGAMMRGFDWKKAAAIAAAFEAPDIETAVAAGLVRIPARSKYRKVFAAVESAEKGTAVRING